VSKAPTKYQRAKVRAALMRKYWGNAYMGGRDRHVVTTSFAGVQSARLEAWKHGMACGLAAGIKLARKP
jgi:hypothetical protein